MNPANTVKKLNRRNFIKTVGTTGFLTAFTEPVTAKASPQRTVVLKGDLEPYVEFLETHTEHEFWVDSIPDGSHRFKNTESWMMN